ncbi:MAG: pseudaminic acid cytidylyltransferase [Paracoccaceae bacterium]|jgi:pseudaminic acid cytidylyltransferase
MNLAVIPARGGSKRIPRKNIKIFGDKPIIAWSIKAAQNTGIFDKIIVSTDDAEIAEVAQEYGAETPFERPAELSGDHIGLKPVISHAIKWQKLHGLDPQHICCIYATAPFIRENELKLGIQKLEKSQADFAFAVTSFAFPIQRAVKLRTDGRVEMFDSTQFDKRSQDLTEAYHDAGQFCWGKQESWLADKPIFGTGSIPILLPRYRVLDIDTEEDWQHAELLMQVMNQRPK